MAASRSARGRSARGAGHERAEGPDDRDWGTGGHRVGSGRPTDADSVDFTQATPEDDDRRRWRVRLGKAPAPGDTIVIRVAPLRTDGGSAEFLVQVG